MFTKWVIPRKQLKYLITVTIKFRRMPETSYYKMENGARYVQRIVIDYNAKYQVVDTVLKKAREVVVWSWNTGISWLQAEQL